MLEYYKEYCKKYNVIWNYLRNNSTKSVDEITNDICTMRKYYDSYERFKRVFQKVGIAYIDSSEKDIKELQNKSFDDMALFTEEGRFLLNCRYIVPVKDMLGNVIALIGWYPDDRKYITTPSKYFDRSSLFFGLEQLSETGIYKEYFLVEGIFDCIALRSYGFPAIAQMGVEMSRKKEVLYKLFKRLVAIPDNDKVGNRVLSNDLWKLPLGSSYLRWSGGLTQETKDDDSVEEANFYIKDIDILCKLFDEESIRQMLSRVLKIKDRVIKIRLE